jgi:glucose/arabinose dehydrogenase
MWKIGFSTFRRTIIMVLDLPVLIVAVVLATAGCTRSPETGNSNSKQPTGSPAESVSAATTTRDLASTNPISIDIVPVVSGVSRPTFITECPDGSNRLFLLEKVTGRIRIIKRTGTSYTLVEKPFLDIGNLLASQEKEQGLCGLAFHPDYRHNGRFWIDYTAADWSVMVAEYHVSSSDPDTAIPVEQKRLFQVPKKLPTHNGGMLAFGPDGYLYISLGDGGCCDDPFKNAQNVETLPGSILRVDVDHGDPYSIPADNPFAGRGPGRGEVFAYGLRNPWRFSFDLGRKKPRIICSDAGRLMYEEIDIIERGGNYGWPTLEGSHCYVPPGDPPQTTCSRLGKIMPIHDYDHFQGDCCVIGGYVYRGKSAPSLAGKYLYADFCSGNIWALTEQPDGHWTNELIHSAPFMISSFGEDLDHEVYVCEYQDVDEPVSSIYRIVDSPHRAAGTLP